MILRNKFFRNLLLSVVAVVVTFSSLEIIQRIRHPGVGDSATYNSLGFRSPEFSIEKKLNIIRILFVGSSTTFGSGNSLENTFPFLVGELLKEKVSGKTVEAINASRPGRNSFWVAERVKDTLYLKPDILIVMAAYNDIVLIYAAEDSYKVVDGKIVFTLPWHRKLHNFLRGHSVFYVTLREKIAIILYGHPECAFISPSERQSSDLSIKGERINDYKANLTRIIRLASKNEIKLVFLKPPISELRRRNFPPYYKGYQMMVEALEEVAHSNSIPLIDIGDFLGKLDQKEIYLDGIHFTDKANREIATGIHEYLLKRKDLYL